jgi:DNA-directed RNA polymerase specialized sigma24 family protein
MVRTDEITNQNSAIHAVASDFCRIFEKDMDRLYLLAFLLTGDHGIAARCFVSGLEDSGNSPRVFKEWAHLWARRMVIQNAIRATQPRAASQATVTREVRIPGGLPAELSVVAALPTFERFVFVMSVLERYSDRDCALLLDCSRSDVTAARSNALRQLGTSAGLGEADLRPSREVQREVRGLAAKLNLIPRLAT